MKTVKYVLLAVVFFISQFNYGQNNLFSINHSDPNQKITEIEIDSSFYSSELVCLITNGPISSLSVTADVKLYNYESYVRILLSDLEYEQDYLVYEAFYPLNDLDTQYYVEDYAYESKMLYNLSNVIVRVEIHNGEYYFSRVCYSNNPYEWDKDQFDKDKRQLKSTQDSMILSALNQRIKEKNYLWVAGSTSVSELYYDQRKDMLPKNTENEIPNLQGLEYYKGGVFEVLSDSVQNRATYTSNYVDEFDWRKRHGENWLTPSKTQSCNHCWVYCPVSVAESSVNLYFNQHIDYDLSEQHVASCSGGNDGNCAGGRINSSVIYIANHGVVTENCFPYEGHDTPITPCDNVCSNPSEIISFNSYSTVQNIVDSIKKAVIVSGPICGGIESLWHFMPIVGFKTLKVGDTLFYNQLYDGYEIIQPNDTRIGQTCWLFKNSKGTGWGHNGCAYFLPELSDLYGLYKLVTPESLVFDDSDIVCEDKDGDGYYNWGIGPKPATCPDCPNEPDCDDSDPTLGPYDVQYGCTSFCESGFVNTPLYINGSTTWNTPKQINRNIEILNGATLNICNTTIWELSSDCSIIIHPGGRLILDGATITNPCGILWKGIEVWGNSSTNQQPSHGGYGQGYLELKNGATIENAVCAVELWHPGVSGTTGGIIHADSAFFLNNAKAVHALNYSWLNPGSGSEVSYAASFRNCTFAIDKDYLGTDTVYTQIDLDHVYGVVFQGCTFSIDHEAMYVSPWNSGISAYDAGFIVNASCSYNGGDQQINACPDDYLVSSSFTGFYDAVRSISDGSSARSFSIRNSIFSDNERGIYALNTGYATILDNEFQVGTTADCSFGIYIESVPGFCIEENTFAPIGTGTGDTYGIGVFNCSADNDVYLNSYDGLTCGNVAVGINTAQSGHPVDFSTTGLTYTCNQNKDNDIDFCVLKNGEIGGIKTLQGSANSPAGNTFDGSLYHFYNGGDLTLSYYYYSSNLDQTPDASLLSGVNRIATRTPNLCATHYGSIIKSSEEKAQLINDYQSATETIDQLVKLYNKLLEQGSTAAQLNDLAAQITQCVHNRSFAAGDIVRSNLNESEADPEELRTWLGNAGDIASHRMAIASYAQEGDFDSALALAYLLPGLYGLKGEDLEDHSDYLRLLMLYMVLYDTGRTAAQMTEEEIALVTHIATCGRGASKSMARGLLDGTLYNRSFEFDCPTLPTGQGGNKGSYNNVESESFGYCISATPNPTRTQLNVSYVLPDMSTQASLQIANALGVNMMTVKLEGSVGKKTIDISDLNPGIYYLTITDDNGNTYSEKVVKQ